MKMYLYVTVKKSAFTEKNSLLTEDKEMFLYVLDEVFTMEVSYKGELHSDMQLCNSKCSFVNWKLNFCKRNAVFVLEMPHL